MTATVQPSAFHRLVFHHSKGIFNFTTGVVNTCTSPPFSFLEGRKVLLWKGRTQYERDKKGRI
jgi:hypothetical protein